jgi:cytochrome c
MSKARLAHPVQDRRKGALFAQFLPYLGAAVALLLAPTVWAAGQGTAEEARAMADKAAEYLKSAGPEKALAEFNAKDGPWHDRDLYVTVADASGIARANGSNPGLVGKSVLELKDPDGKPFLREMMAIKETGSVTYRWLNPVNHAIEPKTIYVVHVGDYTVGVGAYAK